ncbi:MAG: hypothetical protein IKC65_02410 [Lentisphaeria bacterium]|nr:hypothetical protein [Lentisphaeria bacterium]
MSDTARSREVLDGFRRQYNTPYSTADLTATVCALCGVEAPSECAGIPIPAVIDQADKLMDGTGKTEKVLLFCADALGQHQKNHYTEEFERIEKCAGLAFLSATVMPSVTPVCYGTIFSGAAPCVHGITKYEKPVLEVDTLFDAFARTGKNVAICAINECSIDKIFRNRKVDYYSFRSDEGSFDCAMDLLKNKDYDLIVCYMTNYDHTMHKTGTFSPECDIEARKAADRFTAFAKEMDNSWKQFNRALVFVPDHGGHNADERHGMHGTDLPEDMLVYHFYRICEAEK